MTIMIPLIFALAGSVANISDGSMSLVTRTADAGGSSAASQPVSRTGTVVPSITSFSAKPQTRFLIGGDSYGVHVAGKSYSLTNPDSQTLRFEVHEGDHAWYDGSYVDRSEVSSAVTIPPGTPINMSYQFMVEPNGPNGSFVNTAKGWFVAGQLHNDDWAMVPVVGTSPPFAVQLAGNHLQVVARYCLPGGDPSNNPGNNLVSLTPWTDPNPIQAGVYNDIQVQANFSNTSGGYLEVWLNGTQVVNYHGPLGYGAGTNWEYGIYRSSAPEPTAVDYRNLTLATGASTPVSSGRPWD